MQQEMKHEMAIDPEELLDWNNLAESFLPRG
jgi:hypothetical protein